MKPSRGGIGELGMTIKEQNAKELKRKWKEHLKRQAKKNAKQKEQETVWQSY
jgi:hypothetical protein